MTKTAVLISGQARTFRYCLPNQRWMLYRHLPDPHFFVSVADDQQAADMELLREHYEHVYIERCVQPVISIDLPPFGVGHPSWHAAYPIQNAHGEGLNNGVQQFLRQWWQMKRCWQFFRSVPGIGDFDLIVRMRPDLWFREFVMPEMTRCKINMGTCTVRDVSLGDCFTAFWGRFGGINDRFAIFTHTDAARSWFTIFDAWQTYREAGVPLHPETMMGHHLEANGVSVSPTLRALFCLVRPPDEHGAMDFVMPEPTATEMVDFLKSQL